MLKKYFSRGRRQETAILETGEMDRERGSRSKNCKNDFSAQLCA
ncbi:hypothetical protein [Okeania sp. SIO2C2]|nr:hypothetical protein [Okeania sp. SIO2C2]